MPMEELAWRNRFVRELVQNLNDYVEADCEGKTPQVVSGPDNLILLRVSLEEWTQLYSSVMTGADICYPETSDSVRWILNRAVECPVSICEKIIECIETDADVQAALTDFILNNDALKELIEKQINAGKPINPEIEIIGNDDLNALFGGITFLVDTIHDAIVDFNQDAEASNNSRELGQIIFAAIPLLETLPFNEVSDYIDTLFEQIIEVFDSQWDTTPITGTRDRIRCALFCIARDNGNTLTWDLIQNYFYERTSFTWSGTLNIMLEFVNFLATGTWSGEEVVDIAFGNFTAAMSGMGKFGEMLFPSLTSIMRLGQNNPDPDWELLCEDCPPPPADLWTLITCENGSEVVKNSGPESGPGDYVFTFTPGNTGPGTNWLGYFRWGNPAEKFVCTSITPTPAPGPGIGTGFHWPPGATNECDDVSGNTATLPVADGTTFYGGVGMATFPDHEWSITMNITVSTI